VQAAKISIVIPSDRRIDLQLPADLPEGPAEVIVLVAPKRLPGTPDRRAALGMDRGRVTIADDFDGPLPDDLQRAFEGET